MGEALRDEELLLIFFCQLNAIPFPIGDRIRTKVDGHIENPSFDRTHELALRIMLLKMQPAQHAFRAHALVILDELDVKSSLFHIFLVIRLHEIATRIPMNSRLYDAEAFDASHIFCDFDLTHRILVLSLTPC